MKEKYKINSSIQGASMKRTSLVLVLAIVLVFAFSGVAMAKNNVMNYPGSVATSGDGLVVYNSWSSGTATNNFQTLNVGSTSPHGGYATTTVKCAVCHAVHAAAPAGDTLLKMKANLACYACHVTAQLGGTNMVYGGDAAIAANASPGQDGHTTGTNCATCHASVHGAGAIADIPSITGVILAATSSSSRNMNPGYVASTIITGTPIPGMTPAQASTYLKTTNDAVAREYAIGLFCQGCHSGTYQNGTGSTQGAQSSGVLASTQYKGHRVSATTLAGATWDKAAAETSSTFAGKIAWAPASNCKSCHDASQFANGTGGTGFPHYTEGAARFLNTAAYAGAAAAPSGVSVSSNASYAGTETALPGTKEPVGAFSLRDGVCLKCHRGGTLGASGVGFDY